MWLEKYPYLSPMIKTDFTHIIKDENKIPGTKGYYVDIYGNFVSTRQRKTGKLLRVSSHHSGYPVVGIMKKTHKKQKSRAAHILVALTHLPNPNNLPIVDHINGDIKDWSVSNLRWVTHKENSENINNTNEIFELYYTFEELKNEEWKPLIPSIFEGCNVYEPKISNLGRFKYYNKYGKIKIVNPRAADGFYPNVKFRVYRRGENSPKSKSMMLHRLVAIHFLPNGEELLKNQLIVNHKDLNKLNCRLENLEIVSQSDNIKHAHINGVVNVRRVFDQEDIELGHIALSMFYNENIAGHIIREKLRTGSKEIGNLLRGELDYFPYTDEEVSWIKTYDQTKSFIQFLAGYHSTTLRMEDISLLRVIKKLREQGMAIRKIVSEINHPDVKKSLVGRLVKNNMEELNLRLENFVT